MLRPGLIGGELLAIDGCKLPSKAAKEWSGTLEELGKKKKDLEALREKIIAQHVPLDQDAASEKDLKGVAYSYVYNREYQDKQVEWIEKEIRYTGTFLARGEEREGA